MTLSNRWVRAAQAAALAGLVFMPGAALAGPKQDALLQSFVGDWSGTSTLQGGDEPEEFSCRILVKNGGYSKINYQGRCTLDRINLSVTGTIAYDDDERAFRGVMRSNTAFRGEATGRTRGSSVVFDFEQSGEHEGGMLTLDSKMTLNKDKITIDFNVWISDSDMKLSTTVPFDRL